VEFVTVATIALLLALVAGGAVWIVWSVAENLSARRKAPANPDSGDDPAA